VVKKITVVIKNEFTVVIKGPWQAAFIQHFSSNPAQVDSPVMQSEKNQMCDALV
jgi:hypothetical protein